MVFIDAERRLYPKLAKFTFRVFTWKSCLLQHPHESEPIVAGSCVLLILKQAGGFPKMLISQVCLLPFSSPSRQMHRAPCAGRTRWAREEFLTQVLWMLESEVYESPWVWMGPTSAGTKTHHSSQGLRKAFLLGTCFAETSDRVHSSSITSPGYLSLTKHQKGSVPLLHMKTYHDSGLDFLCGPHSFLTWASAHWETMIRLPWRQDLVTFHLLLSDRMPAEAILCFTEDKACLFLENENEVQEGEKVIIICDSLVITPLKKKVWSNTISLTLLEW